MQRSNLLRVDVVEPWSSKESEESLGDVLSRKELPSLFSFPLFPYVFVCFFCSFVTMDEGQERITFLLITRHNQ